MSDQAPHPSSFCNPKLRLKDGPGLKPFFRGRIFAELKPAPTQRRGRGFHLPISLTRALQLALLCAVTVAMLGANESRFDRIGHELMCSCGCNQILLECNHVSCPDSPVMIAELHQQLDSGATDVAVENWFVAKYGPPILAAPIRGGFDNVAWIMPMAVFLLATVGTAALVWVWKRRSGAPTYAAAVQAEALASATTPQDAALRERIRRETEYR